MNLKMRIPQIIIAISLLGTAHGATFTVSKDGRGQFSSIQAAVNKAGKGDVVKILDAAVYNEQVTIDSTHAGLTLTSANPLSANKPTIRWQDKENVGPRTCAEAKDDANVTFDRNGALQILFTSNVTVDGIAVDGGGVYPFGYNGIWKEGDVDCKWPLQHGNGAISIGVSGAVTIRNCDISNAYIGINVKDRNQGGIFGNANPGDNEPWAVVPLSGFGRTGNHIIEQNRIHDNSWGMFFESTWDLGSTIRYNLFYENHHPTETVANQVKNLTSEGANQPGGALWFKDHMLSPLAIYNNTFWHNFLIFAGHWRAGAQHLIFNNICGAPFTYWSDYSPFQNPFHKLDHAFVYRMKHCVYAAQTEAPKSRVVEIQEYDQGTQKMVKDTVYTYQARIMNDFPDPEQVSVTYTLQLSDKTVEKTQSGMRIPGARLIGQSGKAFPAEANIRWLETPFKSTDPTSPDFLVPDWDDSLVQKYIVDQGWAESGVRDADGTVADLGALPLGGGPADRAVLKPVSPVVVKGGNSIMTFDLSVPEGTFSNPRIAYIRFIKNLRFFPDAFGGNAGVIPATDIVEVPVPASFSLSEGTNTLSVPLTPDSTYAFFEIIAEGTGSDGEKVASSVGFMPYRKLEYLFKVTVLDPTGSRELDTVTAGDPVRLKVEAFKADGTPFYNAISRVEVGLSSGADLLDPNGKVYGIDSVVVSHTSPAVFTKVPQDGAMEYVSVSGLWQHGTQQRPFFGSSEGVVIRPGPPEKVVFETPPSNDANVPAPTIDPGIPFDAEVAVYDKYDNAIDQAVKLSLSSSDATKGDITGDKVITTDTQGKGTFQVEVTNGKEGDTFTLSARLDDTHKDDADLRVGKPLDQLWIFYNDVGSYNAEAKLEGQVGERLKVTVWASKDGKTALSGRENTITAAALTPGLQFYASERASSATTGFTLSEGAVELWVSSATPVNNGAIEVYDDSDNTLMAGPNSRRQNISFTRSATIIDSAFYYADNGTGAVDRAEVYYRKELAAVPDSVLLYWPDKSGEKKVVISSSGAMTLGGDNRHLSIDIAAPFTGETTAGNGRGVSYDRPNPDVPAEASEFPITDRVGPLLTEASVLERFGGGNDTLTVTFTEKIKAEKVTGAAFTLIKQGTNKNVELTVVGIAQNVSNQTTIRFAVADLGVEAPTPGDSLRIVSTGPVVDALGNHAHRSNRPVAITLRSRPVPVKAAWYFDRDANGVVDRAVLQFAKGVSDVSDLSATVKWSDDTVWGEVSLLSYAGTDSARVVLGLKGVFGGNDVIRTGGDMSVRVHYRDFDTTMTSAVADSAAPVIAAVAYEPGEIIDETRRKPDLMRVSFSENVAAIDAEKPFLLHGPQTGSYTIELNAVGSGGSDAMFTVVEVVGIDYPADNDSIWIDPSAGITDTKGNLQGDAGNRRALMDVKPMPYKVVVKVAPNPCDPLTELPLRLNGMRISRGTAIRIDPLTHIGAGASLTGSVSIQDVMGNIVARCEGEDDHQSNIQILSDPASSRLYMLWNGRNMNGRIVGTGTYVAMVKATDSEGKSSRRTVKIAVRASEPSARLFDF